MSGECDICGDYGHVEESCMNIEAALKYAQQDRSELKQQLADVERKIDRFQKILYLQRSKRKEKP